VSQPVRPGPDYIYVLQERLAAEAIETAGPRFLDVGCGLGRILARATALTGLAHGVDLSEERVAAAQRACAGSLVKQADASELPFEDGSMDAATVYSTLCVVGDPSRCVAELARVLRRGGRAVIQLHGVNNPNVRFWSGYYRSRGEVFNAYSLASARALLAPPGFRVIKVFAAGLTDAHKYLPGLRRLSGLQRILHSGAELDLDFRLSNFPGLFALASQWFFVVSKI
jgi:SAM-dependent methyltransferase